MGISLSKNKFKGDSGEHAAEGYLAAKGFVILERNYKRSGGEIDLIAEDGEYTVFIEVKYRKTLAMGYPREAVTKGKQSSLRRAANFYITENQLDKDMRFDVVEVLGDVMFEIEHIIDAF